MWNSPLPIDQWVSQAVDSFTYRYATAFDSITAFVQHIVGGLQSGLQWIPEWAFIIATSVFFVAAGGWRRMASWSLALFSIIGLGLVWNLGYWTDLIQTLSLVLAAEILVLLMGLPLGILSAKSRPVESVLRPVLDVMQTMPAFVYLVPAVIFFGLGLVPGVIATTIFALPPLIRLTALGIRQVPEELVEAAQSFGATWWQLLVKVQLPTAMPSIMAGVNQSIMLGLSMVVISAMIGAGGLGNVVLQGITQLDVGKGFVGGLCVVVLAILLDRMTQSINQWNKERHS
ncbi:MAG: opuAB [Desulfomicrobiaceae bacterium]|jgi:glycine betaine/proline transport system permease protein|nr:proline/glycine betaine ABC transporter permease [Desulfomicrobiaceae bacterium]MBZ4648392.1 opuAB [Desulfomicrobiaceae bacterium]MBZ4685699.1 opuAB [Desulfomicrobiaceae bacterium]MDI3493026.1 glycine betaine/proline transport system permease protein [Desulfomicrobiaceae bacterium]HCF05320.1 glycine/betaine ABC transporter [Desulfomicrobiaceae bacterium]